jgi:anaerobic selenocysteine-containing dehydrogenase
MKLSRRCFLSFGIGAAAGITLSPLPWKLTDDISIWTQMWPWTPVPPDGAYTYENTVCTLCPGGCGITVRKVDERAVQIAGMEEHPVNKGGTCILGNSGLQLLYGPFRVEAPMKRTGERGEGRWKRISWKEALSEVSSKLNQIRASGNPHQVAAVSGSKEGTVARLINRFMTVYGSPNFMTEPSIQDSYEAMLYLMQGATGSAGFDFENADYILSFGSGIIEGWGAPVRMFLANSNWRTKGTVVQVDSRLSNTAAKMDRWISIEPGTEAALAMGISHVIIKENLYNKGFIKEASEGFDQYKKLVLEAYSPARVSDVTGIDPSVIEEVARAFAASKHPIAICGRGKGDVPGNIHEFMAVHALNALVGNINSKGGVWTLPKNEYIRWPHPIMDKVASLGMQQERVDGAGSKDYPYVQSLLNRFPKKINEGSAYPIEALLVYNSNPLYSMPDTKAVQAAFDKIPFIVSFSSYMDETAKNADLILPNHTYLERYEDVPTPNGLQYPILSLAKPVVKPQLNTMHTGDVIIKLAKCMGNSISGAFGWKDYKGCLKQTLGSRWNQLYKKVYDVDSGFAPNKWVFETPSGKFEFVSSLVKNADENNIGIPHYYPTALEGDEKKYPLIMVPYGSMKRATGYVGSTPFMLKAVSDETLVKNDVLVQINPKTAQNLGLSQGESATLTTPVGEAQVKVNFNEGIRPGMIATPTGLGHTGYDEYMGNGKGVNANQVIGTVEDPLTGLNMAWGIRAKLTRS